MIKRFIPERGPDELEQRLRVLRRRPSKRFLPSVRHILFAAGIIAVSGAIALIGWYAVSNPPGPPPAIVKLADFPIYYPRRLPAGWHFDTTSPALQNGVVFFSLRAGGAMIEISEQTKPTNPPNLSALTQPQQVQVPGGISAGGSLTLPANFRTITTPVGQAVQGTGPSNLPLAMVLTSTTLINLSATTSSSSPSLSAIIQSLGK